MLDQIRIIRDKTELDGTAYIELLAGPYKNQCWVEGSLFFDEEVFGYLEPAIERQVPDYDHYSFTEISSDDWARIGSDLGSVWLKLGESSSTAELGDSVGFIFLDSQTKFDANYAANAAALRALIQDVCAWVGDAMKTHGSVTVLGL